MNRTIYEHSMSLMIVDIGYMIGSVRMIGYDVCYCIIYIYIYIYTYTYIYIYREREREIVVLSSLCPRSRGLAWPWHPISGSELALTTVVIIILAIRTISIVVGITATIGRNKKPKRIGRTEANRLIAEPAGTGRGNEPNRTEPNRSEPLPNREGKTQAEPRRTGKVNCPNRTEPMNYRKVRNETNRTEPVPSWITRVIMLICWKAPCITHVEGILKDWRSSWYIEGCP